MANEKRQAQILEIARKDGFLSIPATARQLDVSIETVRRDINALCQKGQLKKVRGGAAPVKAPAIQLSAYRGNSKKSNRIQQLVAQEAVKLIKDGSVVALDGGSMAVASCVQNIHDVTFVVHSVPIARTLLSRLNDGAFTGRVIMIGGELRLRNECTYGITATDTTDRYHFDQLFLSCSALSAEGIYYPEIDAGCYTRHLIDRSSMRVLLADSDRLGKTAFYAFAKPQEMDRILVDDQFPFPVDLRDALECAHTQLSVIACNED